MEECIKKLTDYIDGTAEVLIKFNACVRRDVRIKEGYGLHRWDNYVDDIPATVVLKSFSGRQKFYSNLSLIESSIEKLNAPRSEGNRITRIRNIIFLDSQIYVKTEGIPVLRLKDNNGFIALKISDLEYRSISNQIKNTTWLK